MRVFERKDNNIIVDTTKINYNAKEKNQEVINTFFNSLSGFSSSTEMITTWLGREPKEGGKILIGWNTLHALVWALLNELNAVDKTWKKKQYLRDLILILN